MPFPASLHAWLVQLEQQHPPHHIELGLERMRTMYVRLALKPSCPVITVTGTNGKGSTSAMLAAMLRAGGYRVGLYMSPHLQRYNERVRIDGVEADDTALCEAFAAIETARRMAPAGALTYFEFGTLAAFWLFARAPLDVWVLEVGLGGRLDAVNVVDADVAVVTAVDIDHTEYLGNSREAIGYEKAGIARRGRLLICGDPAPPESLQREVDAIGAQSRYIGCDFGAEKSDGARWRYWRRDGDGAITTLDCPPSALVGEHQYGNAAMAMAALDGVCERLPLSAAAKQQGLREVRLDGRLQTVQQRPHIVVDVAHNPHAAQALVGYLQAMPQHFSRSVALLGMLADKDIAGVIACTHDIFDAWWVAPLPGPRGATAAQLREALTKAGIALDRVRVFDSITAACAEAAATLAGTDRMVVFGSFLTVSEALSYYHPQATSQTARPI